MNSNMNQLSYTGKFNIVIDCNNAGILAEFYSKLLGWEWTHPVQTGGQPLPLRQVWFSLFKKWKSINHPCGRGKKGKQGQMLHLDFYVENLEQAVKYAVELGAGLAEQQYFRTSRTMFDPEGHPFCLDTEEAE